MSSPEQWQNPTARIYVNQELILGLILDRGWRPIDFYNSLKNAGCTTSKSTIYRRLDPHNQWWLLEELLVFVTLFPGMTIELLRRREVELFDYDSECLERHVSYRDLEEWASLVSADDYNFSDDPAKNSLIQDNAYFVLDIVADYQHFLDGLVSLLRFGKPDWQLVEPAIMSLEEYDNKAHIAFCPLPAQKNAFRLFLFSPGIHKMLQWIKQLKLLYPDLSCHQHALDLARVLEAVHQGCIDYHTYNAHAILDKKPLRADGKKRIKDHIEESLFNPPTSPDDLED